MELSAEETLPGMAGKVYGALATLLLAELFRNGAVIEDCPTIGGTMGEIVLLGAVMLGSEMIVLGTVTLGIVPLVTVIGRVMLETVTLETPGIVVAPPS